MVVTNSKQGTLYVVRLDYYYFYDAGQCNCAAILGMFKSSL